MVMVGRVIMQYSKWRLADLITAVGIIIIISIIIIIIIRYLEEKPICSSLNCDLQYMCYG